MRIFYNSSGFAHHRLTDALAILAAAGYDGISLTLDVHHADPTASDFDASALARLLADSGLEVAIETGGRYILDTERKHRPNLLDEGAAGQRRVDFYKRALDLAVAIKAPLVSLWSGSKPEEARPAAAMERLCQRLSTLLDHAAGLQVALALEPEPGMFIESLEQYSALAEQLGSGRLRLTCDLGHLYCTEAPPYPELLRRHAANLVNVHVDDIAGRRHEHLELGQGEIDFPPLLSTLLQIGFDGPLSLELSRSSHRAVEAARSSIVHLRALIDHARSANLEKP